ncbi:Peptidyl-prolyl cis-trans isomerase E [Pleurostoma richardsiae]|uniref:Peptidyl-prolyl cis-trans isomerase E n=1 Tax=Pleurostoma richardsiae TaxID=41990 RepID=A0AA38VKJ2_9PEZI|nr:Peptidyl-prolyl cis-trans isomerase E [Pleurostoma richardsiae]
MTDSARWKATVYVGGLAPMVTTTTLHDAFIPFGEIADVSLPKNENPKSTEPHRGFAYVEFEDPEDAKEAIDNMDQSEFFGRVIKVSAAKAPKSADEGLGSKKALWEQESWLAEHAVSEEDRLAAEQAEAQAQGDGRAEDPMQGLEGLDVAGPRPE